MEENVLEIKDLKTYFYTPDGIVKAVDGINLSVKGAASSALSENQDAARA